MKYIYFILFTNIQIFSISQSYVNHFNTVKPDVSFENTSLDFELFAFELFAKEDLEISNFFAIAHNSSP